MVVLHLKSLTCVDKFSSAGISDDPYIKVNQETVWGPMPMEEGTTVSLEHIYIPFGNQVDIELWLSDIVNDNNLGRCDAYESNKDTVPSHYDYTGKGSVGLGKYKYRITMEVLSKQPAPAR